MTIDDNRYRQQREAIINRLFDCMETIE